MAEAQHSLSCARRQYTDTFVTNYPNNKMLLHSIQNAPLLLCKYSKLAFSRQNVRAQTAVNTLAGITLININAVTNRNAARLSKKNFRMKKNIAIKYIRYSTIKSHRSNIHTLRCRVNLKDFLSRNYIFSIILI